MSESERDRENRTSIRSVPGETRVSVERDVDTLVRDRNVPTGFVAQIEHQQVHREFVEAAEPSTVMIPMTHAKRFVRNGKDASWFPSDTTVITTSTVSDDTLKLWSWEREREAIAEFNPDYHVPTDYPVYGGMSVDERRENIKKLVRGTLWMWSEFGEGDDIGIIPLIKGFLPHERELCYWAIERMECDMACLYMTQYLTGGGDNTSAVVEDVSVVAYETDIPLLLIGAGSPRLLSQCPTNVVAGSGGHYWRRRVKPRESSDDEMRERFGRVEETVNRVVSRSTDSSD